MIIPWSWAWRARRRELMDVKQAYHEAVADLDRAREAMAAMQATVSHARRHELWQATQAAYERTHALYLRQRELERRS